jgi:hypothetical protein
LPASLSFAQRTHLWKRRRLKVSKVDDECLGIRLAKALRAWWRLSLSPSLLLLLLFSFFHFKFKIVKLERKIEEKKKS